MPLASSTHRLNAMLHAFLLALLLQGATLAQKPDKSKLNDAAERSGKAARVLNYAVKLPETIPPELIDRAKAIGVFPDLDRLSIVMPKARLAYGVICSRQPDGWSPPAFYGFGAPKIPDLTWEGKKRPDIIILFMSDKALEEFQKGDFIFKDALVGVAGPVGGLTSEKQKDTQAAGVLIYALVDGRVEGLGIDAGVLGGGATNPDNHINDAIYGLKGREILSGKAPLWPSVLPSVADYPNELTSLSKH